MSNAVQEKLVELAKASLYPNYAQPPIVIVRGRGCDLWDASGRQYLDLFAGIAVNTLGHAHPRLVSAIATQAASVMHVSNYYYNEPNLRLAARLCSLTGLARVLFSNSGTEAIEAMLKLARRHFYVRGEQDRYRVVAFDNAFHGRTMGSLAVTGQPKYRDGFGPLLGVTHVPFGDVSAVRAAMAPDVAAILVEPIQGEGGVIPAPPGFLAALRATADEHGALLLGDEVQTGVGRTGAFLGFQREGVVPDAVALAKAMGGGFPIGAVAAGEILIGALPPGSHGSTFAGNALASAAALAVLDVIEEEGLVEGARTKGEHLAQGLTEVASRHPTKIVTSRGVGLLQALVLAPDVAAAKVLGAVREEGVLLTLAGGALRFSPALTITLEELDRGLACVDRALAKC
ncbi:MAG: acetylornithine/succinylornithine family transaminase [Polyangiaceae bacterium]|nr:acetylornithine/succinylornithine family transaminase [Polyangiaceae bacterium]